MLAHSSPAAYIVSAIPVAQAMQRALGIRASVAIAQSAYETGWGKSSLALDARNYFGMRTGSAGAEPFWTGQVFGPGWRQYADARQSFMDFAYGFYTYSGYRAALAVRNDPEAFVRAEAPVYAPAADGNPDYADRVIAIIRAYDLTQYDLPASDESLDPLLVPPQYRPTA